MKTALLLALFVFSFSAFSQSSEEIYSCKLRSTHRLVSSEDNFSLGTTLGTVSLEKNFNGTNHYYHITIWEYEGRIQFQYMEGKKIGEVHIATNAFSTDIKQGQESFHAGTFICGDETSCWTIDCELKF
jgi:hypothetical protein